MQRNIAIDCFSGAGGLSLGLKQAGFQVKWAFDYSEPAISTYKKNLGAHAVCANAEDINVGRLLDQLQLSPGECDLVAGGPPCQGFSVQRRGADSDPRNDMVLKYFAMIRGIRPKFFLLENVPALQGPRGNRFLNELRKQAAEAGYAVHTAILNAADFGVPQLRKRLFVVGELTEALSYFNFPPPSYQPESYKTVREAIGDLPSPTLNSGVIPNHELGQISELNQTRISYVPPGGGREYIPDQFKLACHRVSVAVAGHRNVYGRLPWDRPANTITTKCNSFTRGMFAHPESNRNITMREAARLQGFPDNFVFLGNRVDVAHQIGNAVPPPLAKAVGCAIAQAIEARHRASLHLH